MHTAYYDYQSNVYIQVCNESTYIENAIYDFVMFYVCSRGPPTFSILPSRLHRHAQCAEQISLSYFGNVRDCQFQKVFPFDSLLSVAVGKVFLFPKLLLGGSRLLKGKQR